MAVVNIDPPPNTDDVRELRLYVSNLYDVLINVLSNLDSDNMSEEFLESLGGKNNGIQTL